jgi:hypothetical protein
VQAEAQSKEAYEAAVTSGREDEFNVTNLFC